MKRILLIAGAVLCIAMLSEAELRSVRQENESPSCAFVQDALRDSQKIEVGATRREIEQQWTADGGMQFREETRYLYRSCEYIRVDIKFKLNNPPDGFEFSPDDIVAEVSKPYLAYPTAD
jgi:hypothetical protein